MHGPDNGARVPTSSHPLGDREQLASILHLCSVICEMEPLVAPTSQVACV